MVMGMSFIAIFSDYKIVFRRLKKIYKRRDFPKENPPYL